MADGVLTSTTSVFDYGCGHGDDLRSLELQGIIAHGWDPVLRPLDELRTADIVNLGYVLNVIENLAERAEVLQRAWTLAGKLLIVSARTTHDGRGLNGERLADGFVTKRQTFQKFFEQAELNAFIRQVLNVEPMAASPGVFYVFRDDQQRETFAASRVCRAPRPIRVRLSPGEEFQQHADILQPYIDFLSRRGRLPEAADVPNSAVIVERLGSLRRARRIVAAAIGDDAIENAQLRRSEDILVYLALARFQRRPRFSALPSDLQPDVRALFQNYERACVLADEVLLRAGDAGALDRACREASVGKLTPAALYVHTSAVKDLPALLRIYEGCARSYVGSAEGANIVKLHRDAPAVSYLAYPKFDTDPHPELESSLFVGLRSLRTDLRDYRNSTNPPILHRKETFLPTEHPHYLKFARLTEQEERAGLFAHPEMIGTRDGWAETLNREGVRLRGHRLIRARS